MNDKPLIIVESPTKVKTIQQYLGNDYDVISCVGHVKDLPRNELGIDIDNDFKIALDVLPEKKNFIKELRKKSKIAKRVLIATDPDREGEAIAAHLALEIPKEKLERVQFTEITEAGIQEGINNIRKIDNDLVSAQTARRVIDRLVGYKVSPVLWATLQSNMNFVSTNLSAGRVQSAAVKIIVDRDRLRAKYITSTFFDIIVDLFKSQKEDLFRAKLIKINGTKIATGNDFDSKNGKLKSDKIIVLSQTQAEELINELTPKSWIVDSITEKPRTSNPKPPFTTSTLQQEASRKLNSSAKETMRNAQQLYENGFITYMRTDSTNLSGEAISGAREIILEKYGKEYLPKKPKQFSTKVKNAQEAHEAIRPANRKFCTVNEVKTVLGDRPSKLYDLIWKRTIASQMKSAQLKQTKVIVKNQNVEFQANGQVILFPGYMKIYVEGQDNPANSLANRERILPELKVGDRLKYTNIEPESHITKPPARYTEASLVKTLEENGIGRPSTFASILATIVNRNYVEKKDGKLPPTYLGLAVTQLLENHFTNLVDREFTAKMEDNLDNISIGKLDALPFMRNFYNGSKDFVGLENMLKEKVDIPAACSINIPADELRLIEGRIGKFGPYLKKGEETRSIPSGIYLGDLTLNKIDEIFSESEKEDEPVGSDPETGDLIWLKKGPYGFYVQLGESNKRKGIPKGFDLSKINVQYALKLLSLPREIGIHPNSKTPISADYGRYGPYIKCGNQNASLRGPETPLDINLEQAVELLSSRNKTSSEIKKLGEHPKTGEELNLKEGRYGPYISDGKVNVSIGKNFTVETITLEHAVDLIDQKRANPARNKRKRKKKK